MSMSAENRLALGLPALLAILLFVRVLAADFVYDDRPLISENPRMHSLSVVADSFAMPYWSLVDEQRNAAGFYRPVGATVLGLSWQVSGGNPWGFHLISLLLHAGCAAAVGALGLALGWRPGVAAAAGALFAVHGAHVEAVAWISAIPELLATLFSLLALRALVRERTVWTAAWLLLAMLSKEASFGVLVLALGITAMRRHWKDLGVLALPALVVYLLRAAAFGDAEGWSWAAGLDRVTTHHGLSSADEIGLSLSLLGRYLGYLLWPWPHRPFDPLRLDVEWGDAVRLIPAVIGSALALAAGVLWLRRGNKSSLILVPLGLCFAALAPVMSTKTLGQFPFEERFLYLPSAGFCLLAVGFLFNSESARLALVRRYAPVLLGVLLVGNIISAAVVTPHWNNEESLFSWAREVSPNSMTPHVEYGRVMLEKGQSATDADDRAYYSDQSFLAYQRSLKVNPDEVLVTSIEREKGNLGQADALFLEGDFRAAEAVYEQVVGHYMASAPGFLGLGNARAMIAVWTLGQMDAEPNPDKRASLKDEANSRLIQAIDNFDRALSLNPRLTSAAAGKGLSLFYLDRFEEAAPLLEIGFEWQPDSFDFALPLAQCYAMLGRMTLARRTLERFLEAAPNSPQRPLVEQFIADLRSR
jgi:tetratricopeptide (TPR) repeat protein